MTSGTEDDTVKVLSRPGLEEMKRLYQGEFLPTQVPGLDDLQARKRFFNSYKWEVREFMEELAKRHELNKTQNE